MSDGNLSFPLPLVESGQKYAPASLAYQIQNMRLSPEGTLECVRGPTVLIPDYGSGYPYGSGRMYGVFHALLDNGTRDVTLIRVGTTLRQQTGWNRSVETIASNLSSDPNARFPDQFVEVAGKIVWNNGVDTPLIYDGYVVLPLGYDRTPGAPSATGPGDSGHPVFRNQAGYSHPGRIGTVGNFFAADQGALLAGSWVYYVQFEDAFGNRSPLSAASGSVELRQELTQTSYWVDYGNYPNSSGVELGLLSVNTDDLTKQFLVTGISSGPQGTVARLLYRTPDLARNPPDPRLLVRIPDNITSVFADNVADGNLGAVAEDYIALPRFSAMCSHQGCLVVLEGRNVRVSEPGFPGTFQRTSFATLDSDGYEPTGVFSFGGELYATTYGSIFRVERTEVGWQARRVTTGIGLVGPNAFDSTEFGVGVGLGHNGFWSIDQSGAVTPISREEYPLFKRLNKAMLPHAAIVWSPRDREILAAIPKAGAFGNTLMMTWDGNGWKRRDYGIGFESLCVTRDWRQYVLGCGHVVGGSNNVFVLSCETQEFTPPTKTYRYRSQWLRSDPLGRNRFDVQHVYIGIVEASKGDITYTVWQNGSRDTSVQTGTLEAINPATSDRLDTLVLGTGKVRTPRLTWKKFDCRVRSCESFAFDLSCDEPTFMALAAFSFDSVTTDVDGAVVSRQ